jgi:hypothetical protein
MHSRSYWCMVSVAVVIAFIAAQSAGAAERDELDERLASLQQENAALKKRLQIENLERENAALRNQLRKSRGDEGLPPRAKSGPISDFALRSVAVAKPATAYAMASASPIVAPLPSWSGPYMGAAFGIGRLRAEEADSGTSVSTFSSTSSSSFENTSFATTSQSTTQSPSQGTISGNLSGANWGGT